jgi:peptidoglycan hydrolase-like protein with peptidoglycan-binding domain
MIVQMLGVPGLEKMSPEFRSELWRVADRLGLDAGYIAAVMAHESGFNPSIINPHGGATGLIQFMPDTARAIGTSQTELRAMSAEAQLKWVERFFRPYAKTMRKDVPGDYLMATFMPAFVGKPAETVLFSRGETGYTVNSAFDHGGKGTITIADVTQDIDGIVAAARKRPSIEVDTTLPLGSSGSVRPSPFSQPPGSFSGGASALPVLRAGCEGSAVALWQRFLNHTAIIGTTVRVTGLFDAMTVAASRTYQSARGLEDDGVIGPLTWATVFSP